MHCEILARDVTRYGHRIKDLHEQIVDFDIKALQDFISKCKCLGHVSRLVITSKHDDVSGEVLLDGEEKNADLDSKDTTVNIVAEE